MTIRVDTIDHRWAASRLSPYVDGELRPRARRRLARHARRCPECYRVLRQLRVLVRELRELRPARPARQRVGERVVAAVREGFDGSGGMPG